MALMTSIRNNLSKLFAVLAFFFIIMIIFDWGLDLTGSKGRGGGNTEVLGKVNGQEVDYRQYSELIRRTLENQKKQTGVDADEETERQVRAQVWNQLVDETLIGSASQSPTKRSEISFEVRTRRNSLWRSSKTQRARFVGTRMNGR
jgi:hypothetical protein